MSFIYSALFHIFYTTSTHQEFTLKRFT